jgi:hypothetical protein
MTPAEVDESNRQFREAWKLYASASAGGEVFDRNGLSVANASQPWFFMNVGFLSGPAADEADLERRAKAAVAYFAARGNPWIFTASEDWWGPGAKPVLSRLGLVHKLDLVGMVAERLDPPRRPLPDADIRRIHDEETRVALADLNAGCYGVPVEWSREAIGRPALWRQSLFGTVAYLGGEPASGAFAVPIDDVLYVGWVATARHHRRQGLAEFVIRRSLEEATRVTGLERTVLHATGDGFPVYLRMGYRAVAKFPIYGPA